MPLIYHYRLRLDNAPCSKFTPLTDMLDNHTGFMPVSVWTIVSRFLALETRTQVRTIGTSQTSQTLLGPMAQTSGGVIHESESTDNK